MNQILTLNLTPERANKLVALLNFAISKGEYPAAKDACPFIDELLEQDREFKAQQAKNPPVPTQTAE